MSFLKNLILLIFVVAISFGSYKILTKGPCDSPITYRLGNFDTKFGISREDFMANLALAEIIWEVPLGRQLFKLDPNGDLSINLTYDVRQATVDKNKVLSANVDQTQASAELIKANFESLKSDYKQSQREYQAIAGQFETRLKNYNAEISYWNARGGAPKNEYEKLAQGKIALEELNNQVTAKMVVTNDLARQVNVLVDKYNFLVKIGNSEINKINQSAGKEFEQGEYVSDATGQRINVYEFDGKNKLVRLLAHEMGHALGIGHSTNPDSIMYYLNHGTSLDLSEEDISELKKVCRI